MLDPKMLDQFTGSETFYRHALMRNISYSEGAKYVADEGGAHWLLDKLATNQMLWRSEKRDLEFQSWKLVVHADKTALLTMEDGNGKSCFQEAIDYTDFPLPGITLWLVNNTIFLPSEY